jgi:hypothetical protein
MARQVPQAVRAAAGLATHSTSPAVVEERRSSARLGLLLPSPAEAVVVDFPNREVLADFLARTALLAEDPERWAVAVGPRQAMVALVSRRVGAAEVASTAADWRVAARPEPEAEETARSAEAVVEPRQVRMAEPAEQPGKLGLGEAPALRAASPELVTPLAEMAARAMP